MKRSTLVLTLIFSFLVGVGFFMRSSFFTIESIQVDTTSLEIRRLVEKSLAAYRGQNLWELELGELTTELTSKSVAIRSVVFQRHWPSTLKVRVEERVGVAQTFIERELWLIDAEGVSFKRKVDALPLFWPLPADHKHFLEALRWLAKDRPQGVNGLTWDKELGLVIYNERKIKIILGRESFSENWKKAGEALQYLKSKGLQTRRIDATYNNRAVVSL